MTASKSKDVMGRVKRTFLRMSSPRAFGGKTKQFDSVVSASVPALIARADAACETAAALMMRNNIPSSDISLRTEIYSRALFLFTGARENMESAVRYAKKDRQSIDFEVYLSSLRFMIKLLNGLAAMADVQNTKDEDEKNLAFFGRESVELLRSIEDAYSDFESSAYHFTTDALDKGMNVVSILAETQRRQFSKADLEKYAKAHEAFIKHYSDEFLNPATTEKD